MLNLNMLSFVFFAQFLGPESGFEKGMEIGNDNFGSEVFFSEEGQEFFFEIFEIIFIRQIIEIFGEINFSTVKNRKVSGRFGAESQ